MDHYEHPAYVPISFALAVHRILHNKASVDDWELLDNHPREEAISWIRDILDWNDIANAEQEMDWWQRQLTIPDN